MDFSVIFKDAKFGSSMLVNFSDCEKVVFEENVDSSVPQKFTWGILIGSHLCILNNEGLYCNRHSPVLEKDQWGAEKNRGMFLSSAFTSEQKELIADKIIWESFREAIETNQSNREHCIKKDKETTLKQHSISPIKYFPHVPMHSSYYP